MSRLLSNALAACIVASFTWTGCFFPSGSDGGPAPECTTDAQCESTQSCRAWRCEQHKCQEHDIADGVEAPDYVGVQPTCQKVVCDGQGGTRTVPDPTAVPSTTAPACQRYACDASGTAVLEPDPTNTGGTSAPACQRVTCDSAGNASLAPDPGNTPPDTPGDCNKAACDASGSVVESPDDGDVPPDSTCFSYSCNSGSAVPTPINPDKNCSSAGYVCGADGSCATCPTPDAACTDPGPGSRSSSSAHDFGGIGRTDSGGRTFCGAVPSGAAEYYTYYDDGTGFLASFDPYFEIRPQSDATMCVYFDCPSISCPSSWTSDTMSGHPGCCLAAAAGAFSGAGISFCDGARVDIKVTSGASCTGYELHFHD